MQLLCLGKTNFERMKAKKNIEALIKVLDFKNRAKLSLAEICEPENRVYSKAIYGLTTDVVKVTA